MKTKYYRPILDDNTHLGNSTKNKGAYSSLTFTNDGNEFVRPADWKGVKKSELILDNIAIDLMTRLFEKGISFAFNHFSSYIENKTEEMKRERKSKRICNTSKKPLDTMVNKNNVELSSQIDDAFNKVFVDKEKITELQLAYFLGIIKGIWLSTKMHESCSETVYEEQRLSLCNKVETLLNTIQKQDEVKIQLGELEKWFDMLEKDHQAPEKLVSMQLEKSDT